ncbi:endolytic transglycosylase MltG [Croceibacter atlanticus]|jgi:UPF0755 protein|uniref:endolytic transglycosylase MltG n=1 Tax=Croceibacter atlanticus TaxID=313588 RepID=UPI0024BA48A8|nr:endolytic transglycosylase MltG [Croceibacter atlanticus]
MYIKKLLAITALLGIVILSIFSYNIYTAVFSANTSFSKDTHTVYVKTGSTYKDVRSQLQPVLKDIESFDAIAKRKGYISNVKAGKYVLTSGMNNNEIVNTLRIQNKPVKLRFNNQERIENLAGRIASQIEADSISLLKAMKDKAFLDEHNFTQESALGMYIPNQYEFFWNTTAEDFRARMLREYRNFWNETRTKKAEAIGLTPQQVTVIASIVQKETAKVDERPTVAGVYLNRYKNGWKLDADPTVIYAVKKSNNSWDTVIKRVLYKDLEIESPYNTYKNKALPPGPIAMPDITSIDAVLNYEKHDYFYFVANVQNIGYHKFAKTLMQHNRNKQEYVRWINKQGINR